MFLEAFAAGPKLVVFGAPNRDGVGAAGQGGRIRTVVADAREAFLTRERFPSG